MMLGREITMTPFIGWFPVGASLTAGETLCETSKCAAADYWSQSALRNGQ